MEKGNNVIEETAVGFKANKKLKIMKITMNFVLNNKIYHFTMKKTVVYIRTKRLLRQLPQKFMGSHFVKKYRKLLWESSL